MPRDGTGASDNAVEPTNNIVHGASGDTSLNRASKVAPLPEAEKGGALEGLNASGGGSVGKAQGKGNDSNKEPLVDQVTK
ncbi:uncharacterized protein BDZ99DRAFT_379732 [Mytilinidion resinicola]|uniref:Uncharacterized protein n=1 Tax=Mytilinidion resinicola TaxID=574789 RepID=A0A6A6Z0N8_9PEZI|nr:uncharacterized protein BDZ99DRAFT_379732 [Mytilinidion resinicola]KAF2813725.1 hypothetical protein BDZ99DRAFT_379732 [Mytilinidion resinicola]